MYFVCTNVVFVVHIRYSRASVYFPLVICTVCIRVGLVWDDAFPGKRT